MQGHGLAVRLHFARIELSCRAAGLFPHSWTSVSVRPSALRWRAVHCRCNWSGLGVKQRLCSGRWRGGRCDPDAARFIASHPGRLSLHPLCWGWSEQPKNTERTGVALRQVIKSEAGVTGMGRTAIYGGAPLPFSFPLLFARSSDIWRDLSVTTSQRAKLRFGMTGTALPRLRFLFA
jgi:hypothetical protein